jgi:hypothetical protein
LSTSLLPFHPAADASGQRRPDNISTKLSILSVLFDLFVFGTVHAEREKSSRPEAVNAANPQHDHRTSHRNQPQ